MKQKTTTIELFSLNVTTWHQTWSFFLCWNYDNHQLFLFSIIFNEFSSSLLNWPWIFCFEWSIAIIKKLSWLIYPSNSSSPLNWGKFNFISLNWICQSSIYFGSTQQWLLTKVIRCLGEIQYTFFLVPFDN